MLLTLLAGRREVYESTKVTRQLVDETLLLPAQRKCVDLISWPVTAAEDYGGFGQRQPNRSGDNDQSCTRTAAAVVRPQLNQTN